jgi:ABC-2 type transport system permease protein
MRLASKPGFWLVAQRECRWLFGDRVALLLIFGVPLFAFVVLTTVFSHPVIRGLGVTVVDQDRCLSRAGRIYCGVSEPACRRSCRHAVHRRA